jgi:hypothetical protein
VYHTKKSVFKNHLFLFLGIIVPYHNGAFVALISAGRAANIGRA